MADLAARLTDKHLAVIDGAASAVKLAEAGLRSVKTSKPVPLAR